MNYLQFRRLPAIAAVMLILLICAPAFARDPLPSWNEGKTKQAIQDFVKKVTHKGGADFVVPDAGLLSKTAPFRKQGLLAR